MSGCDAVRVGHGRNRLSALRRGAAAPPDLTATLRYYGPSLRNSAKTVRTLENQVPSPAGLLDKILTREGLLGRSWIRYSGAVGLVGAALAVRALLLPANGGFAFITFYPTVIAAALVFGVGPGVLASALSALCAAILFLSPLRSKAGQIASFGFFFVTCGLTTF